LIIALFLGQTEAVTVQKLLNPLHYAIQQKNSLAQTGSSTRKFMSVSSTLDIENSFESSHTSRLDDYLNDAKESGDKHIKSGDNQNYDAKQAIREASSSLGSMVE